MQRSLDVENSRGRFQYSADWLMRYDKVKEPYQFSFSGLGRKVGMAVGSVVIAQQLVYVLGYKKVKHQRFWQTVKSNVLVTRRPTENSAFLFTTKLVLD